jgi:aarF domain-containing kinase
MLDAEARHLMRFIHLFKGRQGVSFPVPKYPLVAPAVLVESFEFATSVTDSINSDLSPIVRQYVVRQGTQIYLQMLLADNFMHADLHPGNILLRHKTSGEEVSAPAFVERFGSPRAASLDHHASLRAI